MVLINGNELLSTIERYSARAENYAVNPRNLSGIDMERMVLNINRQFLNFLCSARSFLDHNETKIKKYYGKQSERYERFKDATREVSTIIFHTGL